MDCLNVYEPTVANENVSAYLKCLNEMCLKMGVTYRYLDFTEISKNICGYFDKNIGNAKINKNTLKFTEILC